jgi:hypothetical protein
VKRLELVLSATLIGAIASPTPAVAGGLGTVEGSVIDETGKVLAAGVRIDITCGKVKKSAKLDAGGQFRITGLPEGTCTLTGNGKGFGTYLVEVTVAADSIVTLLVTMAPPPPPVEPRDVWAEGMMPEAAVAPMPAAAPAMDPAPEPAPRDLEKPEPRKRAAGAKPKPQAQARPVVGAGGMPAQDLKMNRKNLDQLELPKGNHRIVMKDEEWGGKEDGDDDGRGIGLEQQAVAGWAPVRVFPVPQYPKSYDGPRTDFRETIYWNPSVETNAQGKAEVTFVTSDAVTAFRATAEGFGAAGTAGAGQLAIKSKLPLTLDAKLPVEVTAGDTIRLPVSMTNETETAVEAQLAATFGSAFKLATNPAGKIKLAAGEKKTVFFPLEVVATEGDAEVALALTTRGLKDELTRKIRVVPKGFPFEVAASGTVGAGKTASEEFEITGAIPGSIRATVMMYPSPLAQMTEGMAAMIREPGGCFEQTSSTNYPNIMILGYLDTSDAADPALVEKTQGVLDRGYKLLTGYETKQNGYEWFGQTPGHEALTAYGLMEFADMSRVYDVDRKMVERTADWLMSRRDKKGGFLRSAQALDSFGRAGEDTTNAYIMWALAEAKRTKGLDAELAEQRTLGGATKDPYLLALATNTALVAAPTAAPTSAMVKRLVAMQGKDGGFAGAKESITMSGGDSLDIETTALAVLAMIKASKNGEHDAAIRASVDWLNAHRGGYGEWSNTQATVLGLKALTAYTEHARQMQASGTATLVINGKPAGTIKFEKGRREALVWNDLRQLQPGKNTIELALDGQASLPYSIAIEYRSALPQTSPDAKIGVATELLADTGKMGDGITLRAKVENKTAEGVPMTLARIGIPGGMVFQTWQLKELRDKGLIDFYETRPREVILYWRALPPSAKKEVDLNLLASTPGAYEAPASSAYLYYTDEDKTWTPPVKVTISE